MAALIPQQVRRPTPVNAFPHQNVQTLSQFPSAKLKALQDAFLSGKDLSASLGSLLSLCNVSSSPPGVHPDCSNFVRAAVELASATCWSIVAPLALNYPKATANGNGSLTAANLGRDEESARTGNSGELLDAVVQGESCTLAGWMKDWKGSEEQQARMKRAIEAGPEKLVRDKNGVRIVGHADFGLKRVGWSSVDTPAVPYDRQSPQYFRTLTVSNEGSVPLILLDVCGLPSIDETFVLHDDFNVAHSKFGTPKLDGINTPDWSLGISLQPGAEYQVTVELRCSPQDIAWHQQWLLFMFASGGYQSGTEKEVFIIGRKVSALVTPNIQDVQRCLSTEAKPFYPAALRNLFDTSPIPHWGDVRQEVPAMWQTNVCSVWPHHLELLELALASECSNEANGAGGVALCRKPEHVSWESDWPLLPTLPKVRPVSAPASPSTPGHSEDATDSERRLTSQAPCPCISEQLRQLSRLLALEEAAMERDIKEHDLYSVNLSRYAVGSGLISREYANTFTLEVPGLPENRPAVFVGDLIYLRWEWIPGLECGADVIAIESVPKPRLILRIPDWFLKMRRTSQAPTLVHVRFTFDRIALARMHTALVKVAKAQIPCLPCRNCVTLTATDVAVDASSFVNEEEGASFHTQSRKRSGRRLEMVNKALNLEQQEAVSNVVERVNGPGPYIILGPPGTGKTVTVVECVLQLLRKDSLARICVCAPSNYAADILCSGIAVGGVTPTNMWRMNDPRRTLASIKVDVLPFCNYNLGLDPKNLSNRLKVIVCTCGTSGMLGEAPLLGMVDQFTHVIIDEAGQALIPETLIPLSLAQKNACWVLCGDPKQLGPVVHSRLAVDNGLDDTLIARYENSDRVSGVGGHCNACVTKLVRNYRTNGKLLELPSRMFYNNELLASAEEEMVTPPRDWQELKGRDFPMLFYGVKGQQMREGESPSYFNPVEAGKVADLIDGLIQHSQITAHDIGVIAPYRRQVQKLRLVLRSKGLRNVRVGTVDDYQGQEERIMFISTVLTRPDSLKKVRAEGKKSHLGFLNNAKRFNVAITRAKAMLVVVGHPLVLAEDENWSELLRYCLARDAFRGYGSELVPSCSTDCSDVQFIGDLLEDDSTLESKQTIKAIEKIAELSLLGMGDVDRLYPADLDSMYSAFNEEMEWRVQL